MPPKRRKPDDLTAVDRIDSLDKTGPKRDRSWDKARAADKATYLIGLELKERIKEIAEAHHKPAYYVARRLLKYALDAYDRGDLAWEKTLVEDFTLKAQDEKGS